MEINRPEVVAEVAAAFAGYEKALVAGDPELIVGYFWESDEPVRFGVADQQLGYVAQRAWRRTQPPPPPGRRLRDTRILALGPDHAVVTTLFDYPGRAVVGRQSQTWVRLSEGWRIVSAHVSEIPDPAPG